MSLSHNPSRLSLPVSSRDHCYGCSTAKLTVVEYGDYQCLACKEAHDIIQAMQQRLGDRFRFVFRHFPQATLHPEAHHAAEAAEAAASQGKFWEMHAHLFENQANLADSDLVEHAIALYLNVDQFLQEMAADRHVARIHADIKSGTQSNVIQTPTFFINGIKNCNSLSEKALLSILEKVSQ